MKIRAFVNFLLMNTDRYGFYEEDFNVFARNDKGVKEVFFIDVESNTIQYHFFSKRRDLIFSFSPEKIKADNNSIVFLGENHKFEIRSL